MPVKKVNVILCNVETIRNVMLKESTKNKITICGSIRSSMLNINLIITYYVNLKNKLVLKKKILYFNTGIKLLIVLY